MRMLPCAIRQVLAPFAPLFSTRVFGHAVLLLIGSILAPGRRTVTAALRMLGLEASLQFQNYHRVLNRARWCVRQAGHILLQSLVDTFAPEGPLVFGLDDTIERRWGRKIKPRGIYRDPVRSSHGHFVKASGLRWLSLMLLTRVSWAGRVWALPFLTVLCPSERYARESGKRHKTPLDWARQMVLQLRRWLPDRTLILVGDNTYAALEWLDTVRRYATLITRLRLDAALYQPAPPRSPGTMGRPRKKGPRLPNLSEVLTDPKTSWQRIRVSQWYGKSERELEIATGTAVWYHAGLPVVPLRWVLVRDPEGTLDPKAFLSTELGLTPMQILTYFVRRWQVEVTFAEVRRHLGVESQRQWSNLAIARTTPCLLGLFSLVTLAAHRLNTQGELHIRQAAWYDKAEPTFSDALAAVRRHLWHQQTFSTCPSATEILKIPRPALERLTQALAYAA
ncbi:MAG TPA: transposase [Longimicrobiaceae bacterium]|nr:transposase [Longimicrobiaceae bacterium]